MAYDDTKINWDYCQSNSEKILAEGLYHFHTDDSKKNCDISGNYLIKYAGIPYYIGEAEDISKRLKTQFSLNQSTFYKNYRNYSVAPKICR